MKLGNYEDMFDITLEQDFQSLSSKNTVLNTMRDLDRTWKEVDQLIFETFVGIMSGAEGTSDLTFKGLNGLKDMLWNIDACFQEMMRTITEKNPDLEAFDRAIRDSSEDCLRASKDMGKELSPLSIELVINFMPMIPTLWMQHIETFLTSRVILQCGLEPEAAEYFSQMMLALHSQKVENLGARISRYVFNLNSGLLCKARKWNEEASDMFIDLLDQNVHIIDALNTVVAKFGKPW